MANINDTFIKRKEESKASVENAKKFYLGGGEYADDFAWIDQQELIPHQERLEIPFFIMKMPDLLVISKDTGARLVEVKGGCKGHVKLKFEDLKGYRVWNKVCKVYIHIDRENKPLIVAFEKIDALFKKNKDIYKTDFMPDNMKCYFELPYADII